MVPPQDLNLHLPCPGVLPLDEPPCDAVALDLNLDFRLLGILPLDDKGVETRIKRWGTTPCMRRLRRECLDNLA